MSTLDNPRTLTRQEIQTATHTLQTGVDAFRPMIDRIDRPLTHAERTLSYLIEAFSQRVNGINHHLGWAKAYEEGPGGGNTVSAWVEFLQAETLAHEIVGQTLRVMEENTDDTVVPFHKPKGQN